VQPGRARAGDELTNAFAEPLARLGDGEKERSVDACQYGCPALRIPRDRRDPDPCREILLFGVANP
jgi:hypothetical protein